MGNCISSDKDASNTGSTVQSKRHNENSAANRAHPHKTHKSTMSQSTTNGAKTGAASSSSWGSTASPSSGGPGSEGADGSNPNNEGTNSSLKNSAANVALPGQDSKGRQEVKILLLGSGESGKSTILKQMKIIHQNGYSQEDLLMYKTTVYKNLLDSAKSIVAALDQFNLSLEDEKITEITETESEEPSTELALTEQPTVSSVTSEELEYVQSSIISPDLDTVFDPQLVSIIKRLWAHPKVKKIVNEERANFYIMDSAPYFFSDVDRIGSTDYIPNVADILRARIKTTGIYETRFEMGKLNIHMFDVGGQRSERRKWINCFDNVTLIIFCVALSEYDQVLLEENSQNRMAESLVLFDSIINSRWFARTSVVLFLNKIDVFTAKLPYSPLENYFPDYTGGNDIKSAAKYILWRFNKLNRNQVNIYPHLTQATDTSNIRLVFAAVKETILQNSLRDSGIL